MTNFEKLVRLIEEKTTGGYKAVELTTRGFIEHRFRRGAGAHNLYSTSKSVTSCAVGILYDEGKISDTDTFFSYIGDLFPDGYDPKWEKVTLRDVMLHRTGVPQEANIDIDAMDFWDDGRTDFLKHMLSQPIIYEPGEGPFIYCDTNFYLIGRVVEAVTGMTCGAFLQERMFDPLKWRGHAWGVCPHNHTLCGTGLFADARDLAAYGMMLARGGVYEGRRILSEEWINRAKGKPGQYGYGFTNSEDDRWFFAGGMYGQGLFIFPETLRCLVVLGMFMPIDDIKAEIVPLYLD
ncbi:MAG: beta-lactamase family protein [Clostridia bacterium]|nr:beta-lactamase family protein [Clostridia bacterium]